MKKLIGIVIAIITLLALTVPAVADDGPYTKIQIPFTLDQGQPGTSIETGATIHHLANGVTEVYGADKSLRFKAKESEASMVATPNGLRSANRIYHLPNGSTIIPMGITTQVFDINETLILTIIDDNSAKYVIQDDPTNGWVAHTYRDVSQITRFNAYWTVPARPPSDTCVDFYFNGITKSGAIIQPVLQWNQVGNHKWQIQSVCAWIGGMATGAAYDVTQGSTIRGLMQCANPYNGTWLVNTYCNGVLRSSLTIGFSGIYVLRICCTLEVVPYGVWDNSVLPGGTHFYNMSFTSPDTILWTPVIDTHGVLDLSITYTNPTPVYIITN